MRRLMFVAIMSVTILIVALTSGEPRTDIFGIEKLRPSMPDGMYWAAKWDEHRELSGEHDSQDPWFFMPSSQAWYTAEDGVLKIGGPTPRMSIHDPQLSRQWRDVEITMYFKRVSDRNTHYAGMVAVARSNHGATGDIEDSPCDTRGVGGRMRYDGTTDFEREISHPNAESRNSKILWPDGMPTGKWLGYKYLVYDLSDGRVKLELWLDETEGKNGGTWKLVNEMVDDGRTFGEEDEPCAPGVDSSAVLNRETSRQGSESGKPNISVYFRSDDVNNEGLLYKWGSVREIEPTFK